MRKRKWLWPTDFEPLGRQAWQSLFFSLLGARKPFFCIVNIEKNALSQQIEVFFCSHLEEHGI